MPQLFSGARRVEFFPEKPGRIAGFEMDKKRSDAIEFWLKQIAAAGPKYVADGLNFGALTWQHEIVRHVPVDTGLLRESFTVAPAHAGQGANLVAAVGTNVPYAAKLEFGDDKVAGGIVKEWRYGDPPIYDWPAKRRDASKDTTFKVDALGRGRNAKGGYTSASTAEHMPFMRSTWPAVEKAVVDRITKNMKTLMDEGRLDG